MKSLLSFPFLCLALRFIGISTSLHLHYDKIINLGDSLSDTGNAIISNPEEFANVAKLPYGETYFHHATGRCSNGRLIIDFIAEAAGLPFLPPYLKQGVSFKQGVNFAVAGATALDAKFFYDQNISLSTNNSLNIQLGWFKKYKSSVCTTKQECEDYFKNSLFLVGEIGANDYNVQFTSNRSIEQALATVPLVIQTIIDATIILIKNGAKELVIPGLIPLGCGPYYLTVFKSSNESDYDKYGCLKKYNAFFRYHDDQVKKAVEYLREKYPYTNITYFDYYGTAMKIYKNPDEGHFLETHKACCGIGGAYNFNVSAECGDDGAKSCRKPSRYVNWDGFHLTQAAYKDMAIDLIKGLSTPPLN